MAWCHTLCSTNGRRLFPRPDVWQGKGPIASSGISQPPLVASFARKIHQRDPELGMEKLKTLFPALVNWHRWYMDCRAESGVVASSHPWESGRDNAPDWDEASEAIDISNVGEYKRRDTSMLMPRCVPPSWITIATWRCFTLAATVAGTKQKSPTTARSVSRPDPAFYPVARPSRFGGNWPDAGGGCQ